MCRLILFNKRRVAEVEDLPVEDFQKRPKWTSTEEFEESLTDMEKTFAKRMDLVEGFGKSKKNMKAYILLTPDSKRALEVLTRYRSAVGVCPTNKYMFARLHANTPLSGTTAMKELLGKCEGLKNPENITSTSLRKYIATVSQILDMTQGELKLLAKHLGHDVKTHKEYYQLSSSVLELSKVARMLYAVENGQVNAWAGKKMKDIQLEELPEPLPKDDDIDYELAQKEDQSSSTADTSKPSCSDHEQPSNSDSEQLQYIRSKGKRGTKRQWTKEETDCLRKKFKGYLSGIQKSVHQSELKEAQKICSTRTLPQLRAKLNNIKLGKSNC